MTAVFEDGELERMAELKPIRALCDRLLGKEYKCLMPDGKRKNYGVLLKVLGCSYPWTNVALTEGGKRLLEDNPE